jgi:SAM-dependent methyltransferase
MNFTDNLADKRADRLAAHPLPDKHLDLGCGKFPRNPYNRAQLCGVDIRGLQPAEGFEFRPANLALEPIPYANNSFASVSAFDFIEHIPRLLATADGQQTFFPFVRLMDEVWRVLAPGGRFYALTPTYPNPEVFVDPTHVNIITEHTHEYFCGDNPLGRMYGFQGHFKVRRAMWADQQQAFKADFSGPTGGAHPVQTPRPRKPLYKRMAGRVRQGLRWLRGRRNAQLGNEPRLIYFLWELEAVKATSS